MKKEKPAINPTCKMDDCDSRVVARGYCWKHYRRYMRHKDASIALASTGKPMYEHVICTVEGCELPHKSKGFCMKHYQADKRRRRLEAGECTACGTPNDGPYEQCSSCRAKRKPRTIKRAGA